MKTYDEITKDGINSIDQLFEAMEAAAKDEDGGGELEFRFIGWLAAIEKLKAAGTKQSTRVCVDWHRFDPDVILDGKFVSIVEGKNELLVATTDPLLRIYASKKINEKWDLKVSRSDVAKLVLGVCEAADEFERQWYLMRTPTTDPPKPWRWGISRFNRLQLESSGREGIELPRDAEERNAYVALAKQFDAMVGTSQK